MNTQESAISLQSQGTWMYGVLHDPVSAEKISTCGVILIVGGPQTRVGSHRQFVMLARDLANAGIPVMRFDYRGMGDSEGEIRTFESIDDDIRAAIDRFAEQYPHAKDIVLWGLCDAASASCFYAYKDARVKGMVLLNPWVRTESGIAKAYLKHYYLSRFFSKDFWGKVVSGKFNVMNSLSSLIAMLGKLFSGTNDKHDSDDEAINDSPLPEKMLRGLQQFQGRVLFILSGNDFTADEFRSVVSESKQWQKEMSGSRVLKFQLDEANHTFSRRAWRDQVSSWTLGWLKQFDNERV